MSVEVAGVTRRFGPDAAALDAVSLQVRGGEFVALLGPSGSGKTTLLRILAGLDMPDAGTVRIDGRDMAGVAARSRGIGFVFQNYALFRHMTVAENVAFGLEVRSRAQRPSRRAIEAKVAELLALVQIPELARRRPDQLSGGQRQRVALARALAIEPPLLLLDEPFGALDAQVRKDLRRWLRGLQEKLGITTIFVTHDQDEAMEMADRIAVMRSGRIVQFDTPLALLDRPADAFVAGFLGEATRLPCTVQGGMALIPGLPPHPVDHADGSGLSAVVRPHELVARRADAAHPANAILRSLRPVGAGFRLGLEVGGHVAEGIGADAGLQRGEAVHVALQGLRVFGEGGAT